MVDYDDHINFDENTPEYKYYADLHLEMSPSDKATCRGCGKKIAKDILRWCSSEVDRVETVYISKRYYHTACLPNIAGHPIVDYNTKKQTGQMVKMNSMPKNKVEIELFNQVVINYITYRNRYEKQNKKGKKDKNYDPDSDEEDEKPTKKSVKPTKSTVTVAKAPKRKAKDSVDEEDDDDGSLDAYDDTQKQKYKAKLEELKSKNINQLKAMLKANSQVQSGNKGQLVEKVADGLTLGAIPQCTKCGGGKLRFNQKTGQYTCPGYMEDTEKINCDATFKFNEVVRFDWVDA